MMTPYNFPHRKLHHLFNYHALPVTMIPVENCVWGFLNEGAGTFMNCYKRYVNAKQYCERPFDKIKQEKNKIRTIYSKSEEISARFVSSFKDLQKTSRSAMLINGDSSNLSDIPDKSIDLIVTDPPYYDNIHYSELSNFFYVWLRSVTNSSLFTHENVPTKGEAIVNQRMGKNEHSYEQLLTSIFSELERVLKTGGRLIFTFHHSKWHAWWTVLSAVCNTGFRVVDYFPVMSEYKVSPHIRKKQNVDTDLVIVCRRSNEKREIQSLSSEEVVQRVIDRLSSNLHTGNRNNLLSHYIGEIIMNASSLWETRKITQSWFQDALVKFDKKIDKNFIEVNKKKEKATPSILDFLEV
jgi:putative DNA methylase